jgi:hypothetical protein
MLYCGKIGGGFGPKLLCKEVASISNFFNQAAGFRALLDHTFNVRAILFVCQLAQNIGGPSWVIGIDLHFTLLMACAHVRLCILSRMAFNPVWIRKPTLPTERWVMRLISR